MKKIIKINKNMVQPSCTNDLGTGLPKITLRKWTYCLHCNYCDQTNFRVGVRVFFFKQNGRYEPEKSLLSVFEPQR